MLSAGPSAQIFRIINSIQFIVKYIHKAQVNDNKMPKPEAYIATVRAEVTAQDCTKKYVAVSNMTVLLQFLKKYSIFRKIEVV